MIASLAAALLVAAACAVGSAAPAVPARVIGRSTPARPVVSLDAVDRWLAGLRSGADELPELLDDLARGLRSGRPVREVLTGGQHRTGRLGGDIDEVVRSIDGGVPLVEALRVWADQRGDAEVSLAVAALTLGLDAGGPRGRAVEAVAATVRERRELAAELRAQSAQARLSALVIGVAPIGFLAVIAATNESVRAFLLGPVGVVVLAIGGLLDAGGAWWMRSLVRRASWS